MRVPLAGRHTWSVISFFFLWARVRNTEPANSSNVREWCLSRVPKFWYVYIPGPDLPSLPDAEVVVLALVDGMMRCRH